MRNLFFRDAAAGKTRFDVETGELGLLLKLGLCLVAWDICVVLCVIGLPKHARMSRCKGNGVHQPEDHPVKVNIS